jgi:hypothetical protein
VYNYIGVFTFKYTLCQIIVNELKEKAVTKRQKDAHFSVEKSLKKQ